MTNATGLGLVPPEPPIKLPPLPGPLPPPVSKPGSLTTPAPAPATALASSNTVTLLIGVAAVAGVGWLAWYVATHQRPQVPVQTVRTRRR